MLLEGDDALPLRQLSEATSHQPRPGCSKAAGRPRRSRVEAVVEALDRCDGG